MAAGGLFIGTSGWNYPAWRADFYEGVPQRKWLAHCAEHFTGIEVNGTFYRPFKPEIVARWFESTPDGFAFAAKGHRAVTHYSRLVNVGDSIARMREQMAPLDGKLAVVLWQLPPGLKQDLAVLESFAVSLEAWPETAHAIEFRHESWFDAETEKILNAHRLANVISDAARWPIWDAVTGRLAYVRLHGHDRTYASEYGAAGLKPWARRVKAWRHEGKSVHVYFDNDAEGAAPRDAMKLIEMTGAD